MAWTCFKAARLAAGLATLDAEALRRGYMTLAVDDDVVVVVGGGGGVVVVVVLVVAASWHASFRSCSRILDLLLYLALRM